MSLHHPHITRVDVALSLAFACVEAWLVYRYAKRHWW